MTTVVLTGRGVGIDEIVAVAVHGAGVEIAPDALQHVARARAALSSDASREAWPRSRRMPSAASVRAVSSASRSSGNPSRERSPRRPRRETGAAPSRSTSGVFRHRTRGAG